MMSGLRFLQRFIITIIITAVIITTSVIYFLDITVTRWFITIVIRNKILSTVILVRITTIAVD